jgi:formate hydrogenlyase subunit 3/multisubunit Na+/H+ antiporter MnhD subunit
MFSYPHIPHTKKRKMKKIEFHKPFIKNLVFIASCTIVAMILAPIFVQSWICIAKKNQEFTTTKSYSSTESQVEKSIISIGE